MTKNLRGHNCQGHLCHRLLVEVFGLIGPLETEKYMIKSHFSALTEERDCLQVSAIGDSWHKSAVPNPASRRANFPRV